MCLLQPSSAAADSSGARTLYVFVATEAKPRALQKALSAELRGVDVIVYGRYRDFQKALQARKPSAVVAPPVVLEANRLAPSRRGYLSGHQTERYVLLSRNPIDPTQLSGLTVGAIDLLGRREMKQFVADMLGVSGVKRVTPVLKFDDLLSLLHFEAADAVLLPERVADGFRRRSKLELHQLELDQARMALPAVAAVDGDSTVISAVARLSRSSLRPLGIDEWRTQ